MEKDKSSLTSSCTPLLPAAPLSQSMRRRQSTSGLRNSCRYANLLPPPSREMRGPVLHSLFSSQRKEAFERRQSVRGGVGDSARRASVIHPKTSPEQKPPPSAPLPPSQEKHRRNRKSFLFTLLNPHSRRWPAQIYKLFISAIILMDLLLFILSTEPPLAQQHAQVFHLAEGIASCIFLVEYIARLVVCVEGKRYQTMSAIQARLHYAMTWPALIDLFSCLPFFLELPTGLQLPTLTYLRFFRLFRILKTEGSVRAVGAVYRVIYYNREILYVALLICLLLILLTAVLLYYLRPSNPDDSQDFQSILATLYLSTLMLTGQGGPSGELPWYTKLVVLLTSVFSVAMFAIPASMLTWGFEAEAARMAKQARRRFLKQQSCSITSFSSSRSVGSNTSEEEESTEEDDFLSDGYSTDEEYFKIISGVIDDEDKDDEDDNDGTSGQEMFALMKEYRDQFDQAGRNRDGKMTFREFAAINLNSLASGGRASATVETNWQTLARFQALEKQVQANSDKLDRLLELMVERRQKRNDKAAR